MIRLNVPIKPLPGNGFRFTTSGHNYRSKKHSAYMAELSLHAKTAIGCRPPLEGPIVLIAMFHMQRPLTHYTGKKRSPERLRASAPDWHTAIRQCDTDNLLKPAKDACGCWWVDDGHVVLELVGKPYAHDWAVEITALHGDEVVAFADEIATHLAAFDTTLPTSMTKTTADDPVS